MTIPQKLPERVPETTTPMTLLSQAVANGNIELAEKLMALQERYEKNQSRKAFDAAISAAKAELPVILKDKVVDFTSQKGRTNYMYEDFSTIYNAVTPILSKHGLDARFRTVSDKEHMTVICILSHRDGWHEENSLTAPNDVSGNKNPIQAIGSTQTYLQRYTLKAALGLAASKDDDAQAVSQGNAIMADQVKALQDMLKKKPPINEKSFCNYLGLGELSDLSASRYNEAVAAIIEKRKVMEGAA